jgi:hypothetical protein
MLDSNNNYIIPSKRRHKATPSSNGLPAMAKTRHQLDRMRRRIIKLSLITVTDGLAQSMALDTLLANQRLHSVLLLFRIQV